MKKTAPQKTGHHGLAHLPPTQWTAVARAGNRNHDTWCHDLEILARLYRPVLVRHLTLRFGLSKDRAEDWVQAFLLEKLINENVLRLASPQRGRLRSFMLKVFSNFIRSRLREQQAIKRRPSHPNAECLENYPDLPSCDATLQESFDALWARQVLACTLTRLQAECRTKEKRVLWDLLEARMLNPLFDGVAPLPYDELVVRFNLRSPSEASNLLITAKRMFVRVLRDVVRETVTDEREVELEIMELKRILSR